MIYPFRCIICNIEFEVVQSMNTPHKAFHCGVEAQRIFTVPQTNKDLMYQFDTTIFGKRPVNIYSRRQYKRLLKENGLVDSTPRECLTVKPKNDGKERARKLAKKCADKIYKKGAMDWVKGKVNPKGRDKL